MSSNENLNVSCASHRSHRNSPTYRDPKNIALYHKSGEVPKKGIDFQKRKVYVPYRPTKSKFVGLPLLAMWELRTLPLHLSSARTSVEEGPF